MKNCSRTFISCCFICLIGIAQARTDGEPLSINNTRMHNVVKSMLGFKGSPDMARPQNNAEDAPKYMLDLYERYQNGPITRGHRQGNTVRSIKASKEYVNKEEMLVFNLSSLISTEEIISAEIHLYKNKNTKNNTHFDFDFELHEIAPQYTLEIGSFSVTKEIYGWQWFDVTDSVNKCMADRETYPHSLGVTFKVTKSSGSYNMLHWNRFIHQHSLPYLIVYSVESQSIDLDELEKLSERKAEKETVIQSKINTKIDTESAIIESSLSVTDTVLPVNSKRIKRSPGDKGEGLHSYHSRARSLSILTNEIPEDPDDYSRPYPINAKAIQTHPTMLQTRKASRHRLVDSRIIPYPGEYFDNKKKNRLLHKRKKGGKGRKNNTLELPKEWEDLKHMAEEENNANTCSKKKLIVNFNDIGWGDWIISPKSFKAHYCSGSCPFPLTKKMRPSNHATIQSVVNAVGINPDIPAPCCVPDKLSSITLLYFDENRNVVLKNYPNMTVRKCACR